MRSGAAVVAACAAILVLAGCGAAGQEQVGTTITINLPGYTGTGHVASSDRRDAAHPGTGDASGSDADSDAAVAQAPQVTPLTPRANARLNGVSVWIPYWALDAAVSNAVANAGVIKVAHPFIYQLNGTSSIVDQSGGQAAAVSRELAGAHIAVIPTVTETDGMGAFAAVLKSKKKEAAMLKALEAIGEAQNNDGIDLDFENLAYGDGSPKEISTVENLYPVLVAKLCAALHQSGRSCEVTVFAKNSAGMSDSDGLSTYVYNYSALAQVADRLQLMAYDLHGPTSGSGPIAPLPWVQSVLRYALTQIPADKIVLGVPAYGYDWNSGGSGASPLTAVSAEQLASQENAQVQWDAQDEEPYFEYTNTSTTIKRVPYYTTVKHTKVKQLTVTGTGTGTGTTPGPQTTETTQTTTVTTRVKHERTKKIVRRTTHVVWFENTTANYDRAVLAADDNLAGIAIWAGGDEQPGLWSALARLR